MIFLNHGATFILDDLVYQEMGFIVVGTQTMTDSRIKVWTAQIGGNTYTNTIYMINATQSTLRAHSGKTLGTLMALSGHSKSLPHDKCNSEHTLDTLWAHPRHTLGKL